MPLPALAIVITFHSMFGASALAISPEEVARIVSRNNANQRFTDTIRVRDDLAVPILKGSTVMPTIALVDFPVFDNLDLGAPANPDDPHYDMKVLMRCLKLGIGPCQEPSPSDRAAYCSDVQLVIWSSGHVLWRVDDPGGTSLRNRKGQMVAYKFGQIDIISLFRKLEQWLPARTELQEDYRVRILLRHLTFRTTAPIRDLTIIKEAPTFRWQSQAWEDEEGDPYEDMESDNNDPARDVAQFIGLCKAIQGALPAQGYERLSGEPVYEWVGERTFPWFDSLEKKKVPLETRVEARDDAERSKGMAGTCEGSGTLGSGR